MCCRTQLAPTRQVVQVGEPTSTSRGAPWWWLKSENRLTLRPECSRSESCVAGPNVVVLELELVVCALPPHPLSRAASTSEARATRTRISWSSDGRDRADGTGAARGRR